MALFSCPSCRETIGGGGPPPGPPAGGPAGTPPPAPCSRRPAVRRGFCGLLALVGPSAWARPGGGPPLRASARPPARGAVVRLSGGAAASVGLGLSAPALARRSGPRCPPLAPAVAGGLPLRPFGPGLAPGLSPLRARPGPFASPGPAGPPARPAACGGGFALAPPARGRGAPPRSPAPARYRDRDLRRRSRSWSFRSNRMSAMA